MPKGPVRFTSQWVLVGVILFYTVGTAMIASHTKRIFKPASAGGSERTTEYSAMSETPKKTKPVVAEYSGLINSAGQIHWDGQESNLMLYDVAFGAEHFYEQGNNTETPKDPNDEKKDVQQELTKIRTKLKCVETLLKNALIEPYYVNGQIEGLQLNGLDDISEAKELLLNSGDIILAVNGETLSSKKEAYDIFIKARKEPIMIVDILQDEKPAKLLLDFQ